MFGDSSSDSKYPDLTPDFLLEEFTRVYYGLNFRTEEAYLKGNRKGRGKSPSLAGERRQYVWDRLSEYATGLRIEDMLRKFELRRLELHSRLDQIEPKYTTLFVEECQDFLQSDLKFFRTPSFQERILSERGS